MQQGLSSEGHDSSSVKCFPTYVRRLPKGDEVGKFLSLDLGGTNFRVIVMELTEDREFLMDSKIYSVPEEIQRGKRIISPAKFLFSSRIEYLFRHRTRALRPHRRLSG